MAKNGAEPTASMGADIPLAVLSEKHQPLFYYFTCPMGIATQRPELRKNFCGKPDYLVNFMEFVAQELRMIMAKLGVRTVDELVGHTEYLRILPHQITQRAAMVDVSGILARCSEENCHYDPAQHFDFKLDATLDKQVLLTVHSARSSVQRSRDAGAARWRMIPTRSTAAAALDSRSVHFCRRA